MFLVAEAYALRAGPARLAPALGALRPLASAPPAAAEWTVPKVRFVDYFAEKRGHTRVPSSGVVPLQDPTLLFANAGMNQFKPIFLGQAAPGTQLATLERACNAQKCIRAGGKHNDLEDVGLDTYHHTFFEMLGSWSFGDYFKAEATAWAKELLVDVYGLDMDRMYATYFEGSPEEGLEPDYGRGPLARGGLQAGAGHPGLKADNFWEMGDSGRPPARSSTTTRWGRGDVAHLVNMDDPRDRRRRAASNEGRGFVLRRILRRAVRYGLSTLGAEPGFMARLAPALAASHFGDYYPAARRAATIAEVLAEEEATFAKTLERGVKYLDEELDKLEATDVLGGDAAFFLDSLGFPHGKALKAAQLAAVEAAVNTEYVADGATVERAKALRVDVDATPCAASLKPDLRAALEGVAKALGAFDKQVAGRARWRGARRGVGGRRRGRGADRLVLALPSGLDAKAAQKLAGNLAKATARAAL
ncbi:hypothetical protein JL720_15567 [Aureococcus anophagefferens]|nr:hypothetical protein JL720_15567 [Aureococcus anophagefferens]